MKYTKAQKAEYFKKLRKEWAESKKLAENDETAKALYREVKGEISYWSFYFTLQMMKSLGYDGLPYIDCKTFNGWRESGFKVMKGEKSQIKGITWIGVKDDDGEEDDSFVYPKMYHLFHKSQVQAI